MIFYLVLLLIVICTSGIVSYDKNTNIVSLFKIITFLVIFLPAAFRYNVGVDYENYIDIFNDIGRGGQESIEPGYWLLNYIVYKCGGNGQLLLAVSAFITLFLFFHGVENERWLVYSVIFLIICWPWYCSTVRQMISCSMAFYAWRKNNEGHILTAAIFIGIACLFHYSSLIYPIVFFVSYKMHLPRILMVIIFISCVLLCLHGVLSENILKILSDTYYGNRYEGSVWLESAEVTGSGLGRILRFGLYLIMICFMPADSSLNKSILSMFFLYAITDVVASEIVIVNRIGRGFSFICLPAVYQVVSVKKCYRPIISGCIYTILIILFYANLKNGFAYCSPYISIFNK